MASLASARVTAVNVAIVNPNLEEECE